MILLEQIKNTWEKSESHKNAMTIITGDFNTIRKSYTYDLYMIDGFTDSLE